MANTEAMTAAKQGGVSPVTGQQTTPQKPTLIEQSNGAQLASEANRGPSPGAPISTESIVKNA